MSITSADTDAFVQYLCQSCGKHKFAKAAQDKWKKPGRAAYTQKSARRDLKNQGILPAGCVVSWKNCQKVIDDLATKCGEEKKAFRVDAENWLNARGSVPSPLPTAGKDGWIYPPAWNVVPGTAAGSGFAPSGGTQPGGTAVVGTLLAAPTAPVEAPASATEEAGMTSNTKVAIGLGIGALLLVGGLWWASRKKAERSRERRDRRDED